MPTYPYHCEKCDKGFEVVKTMSEYNKPEFCSSCGMEGRYVFTPPRAIIGASVQNAEYNPAFGKIVRNKNERDELAKRNGLIEVGNDDPNKMVDRSEKDRKEKLEKSWEDV